MLVTLSSATEKSIRIGTAGYVPVADFVAPVTESYPLCQCVQEKLRKIAEILLWLCRLSN